MTEKDSKLIEFYKAQWKLIHDLNNLDWRVSLIFVPLMGSISFIFGIALQMNINEVGNFVTAIRLTALVTFLFCIYGLWTVIKGHSHATLKFATLRDIEKELNFDHFVSHRKEFKGKTIWTALVVRRSVLFVVYCIFALMSYSMAQIPITEFNFQYFLSRWDVWIVPSGIVIAFVLILYGDHKIHTRNKPQNQTSNESNHKEQN